MLKEKTNHKHRKCLPGLRRLEFSIDNFGRYYSWWIQTLLVPSSVPPSHCYTLLQKQSVFITTIAKTYGYQQTSCLSQYSCHTTSCPSTVIQKIVAIVYIIASYSGHTRTHSHTYVIIMALLHERRFRKE